MNNNEIIKEFEEFSGLKLQYDYNEYAYRECSGASHNTVLSKAIRYNQCHRNTISCYSDSNRDATYVIVIK